MYLTLEALLGCLLYLELVLQPFVLNFNGLKVFLLGG